MKRTFIITTQVVLSLMALAVIGGALVAGVFATGAVITGAVDHHQAVQAEKEAEKEASKAAEAAEKPRAGRCAKAGGQLTEVTVDNVGQPHVWVTDDRTIVPKVGATVCEQAPVAGHKHYVIWNH